MYVYKEARGGEEEKNKKKLVPGQADRLDHGRTGRAANEEEQPHPRVDWWEVQQLLVGNRGFGAIDLVLLLRRRRMRGGGREAEDLWGGGHAWRRSSSSMSISSSLFRVTP